MPRDPDPLPAGSFLLPLSLGRDFLQAHAQGAEVLIDAAGISPFRESADLVRAVHLPWEREGRIHLADPDASAREADLAYLKGLIAAARPLAPARYVIHPLGLRRWAGRRPGDWGALVAMLRRLADETRADRAGPLVIENNRTYWEGISEAAPVAEADRSGVNRCFGETAEEWSRLQADVGREDVLLCLDLSHAATSAQLLPEGPGRGACLREFLRARDRIAHVHWSDNILQDNRGRQDRHDYPGEGTLPRWFHREVGRLDATFMFEVASDPQAVLRMLAFVRSLDAA